MTVLVALVVVVLAVALALAWLLPSGSTGRRLAVAGLVAGTAVLGLVALLGESVGPADDLLSRSLLVPLAAVAALGGGPVTAAVLRLADREDDRAPAGVEAAASVLRGGAWIGVFERTGVFAALGAG